MARHPFVLLALSLLLAACDGGSRDAAYKAAGQDSSSMPTARTAAVQRLQQEGLIYAPEVQKKSAELFGRAQRGEITPAEASLRLLDWMKEWERAHPKEAETARQRARAARGEIIRAAPVH